MLALVTLVPLVWLLAVTVTAGVQKIWHTNPRIGFLAQAKALDGKWPELRQALSAAQAGGDAAAIAAAEKELRTNRVTRFNNLLDAAVASGFLLLVAAIVVLSAREWVLLLARRKLALLKETEPVWLPENVTTEGRPLRMAGLVALGFALAKELSGEAHLERAQHVAERRENLIEPTNSSPNCSKPPLRAETYLRMTEHRFNGVRRCC